MKFNPIQRQVAYLYCGGEFAHLEEEQDCGDSLFEFCISEASDIESIGEYRARLDTAIRELRGLADDLLLGRTC